jgi:hypothetical protein
MEAKALALTNKLFAEAYVPSVKDLTSELVSTCSELPYMNNSARMEVASP